MKKRLPAMILALAMLFVLTSCGDSAADTPPSTAPAADSEPNAEPAADTPGSQGAAAASGSLYAFDNFIRPNMVDDGTVDIVYLYQDPTSEAQIRSQQQAEIEAAHRGWNCEFAIYETMDNFRTYFENAINKEPDAIVLGVAQNMESYADLVAKAREAGIGVYCNDNMVVDGVIVNVTLSGSAAMMELFYQIANDYDWTLNCLVQEKAMAQVMSARIAPVLGLLQYGVFPNLKLLESQDVDSSTTGSLSTLSFSQAQAWLQKYGDEADIIVTAADTCAVAVAEAIVQWGDPHGDQVIVCGVNGGNQPWTYIRNDTPLKYSYSQPFEAFTHAVFECIEDIQVEGLNPGDSGCMLTKSGETFYVTGIVTTVNNVPAIGSSVHEVFNWYGGDPDDQDAWWNWTDGPGPYIVSESA